MNFLEGKLERSGDSLLFASGGFSLKTSDGRDFSEYAGREVTLGIRPEDIHLADGEETPRPGRSEAIEIRLALVEMLGSEHLVYFDLEGRRFSARSPSDTSVRTGQSVPLIFNTERIHVFDKQSGEALRPRRG